MREIMVNQASSCDLKELVAKFIPESIGKEIEKATTGIYPLQNVYIRKVKILKAPKFDLGKLMEVISFCCINNFFLLVGTLLLMPMFLCLVFTVLHGNNLYFITQFLCSLLISLRFFVHLGSW